MRISPGAVPPHAYRPRIGPTRFAKSASGGMRSILTPWGSDASFAVRGSVGKCNPYGLGALKDGSRPPGGKDQGIQGSASSDSGPCQESHGLKRPQDVRKPAPKP
ncbi:hypothetical protein [Azospirillum palustre]